MLLPLALGTGATAITLGGASLAGASFDAGVAAAMPVLGALAAGWALRLLTGLDAEPHTAPPARRVELAARSSGPTVAAAALASAAAFGALLLSPVSMARSFGALLAIGSLVSLVLTLTAGAAVLGGRLELGRDSCRSPAGFTRCSGGWPLALPPDALGAAGRASTSRRRGGRLRPSAHASWRRRAARPAPPRLSRAGRRERARPVVARCALPAGPRAESWPRPCGRGPDRGHSDRPHLRPATAAPDGQPRGP